LTFSIGEAQRPVDPDGNVAGIGDDDEGPATERGEPVAARFVDEPAGQPAAAVPGIGLDALEPQDASRADEDPASRSHPSADESPEPCAAAAAAQLAGFAEPALREEPVVRIITVIVAGQAQLGGLRPVVVAG